MSNAFHRARRFCLLGGFFILCACGGGSGGGVLGGNDDDDDGNSPPPPPPPPPPIVYACTGSGSDSVTLSGVAEYEFVPAVPTATGARLDFASAEFRPIRRAEIQAICPDGSSTYDTGVTDATGAYSLTVPENVDVAIRVRAIMQQTGTPSWNMSVVDNTQSQAVWSAQGEAFDSATGSATVNLEVASGWDGSGYTGTRAAAPFAILDSVYIAMEKVRSADPAASFPPLKLNWSPSNRACSSNQYPFPNGCISTSFFSNFGGTAGRNIFIMGDAANDTDEYDNHVVIHEWGHYYEDAFARSDSIGGAHAGGDALDPRVAFGEGWGNAWSGIATDDPLYVDTFGTDSNGFWFDIEDDVNVNPGWWNEISIQEIIYDLYDAANDDAATLGFGPIHGVLTTEQRTTSAVTSIFPFVHYLKMNNGLAAGDIDDVVLSQDISPIGDEWGDGRTANDNGSEFDGLLPFGNAEDFVVPVHTNLNIVGDGSTANICTTNAFDSASEYNRLGVRRFLRFQVNVSGGWNVTVEGPPGTDPDFYVMLNGDRVGFAEGTGSTDSDDVTLAAGQTYVLEVLDYENANDDGVGGDTCLDITFTAP